MFCNYLLHVLRGNILSSNIILFILICRVWYTHSRFAYELAAMMKVKSLSFMPIHALGVVSLELSMRSDFYRVRDGPDGCIRLSFGL